MVENAQPAPPLPPPGAFTPGGGRATRREQGISELLKAVAELEAIPASDQSEAVTTALSATKKAVEDAKENIGYPYPPASTPLPKAQGATTAARVANAVRSLTTARGQLNAANTGRGRGAAAS